MKKVVSLLLALLLVLSLAACGEQKTPDNSDPGTENTLNYPTSPITLYCPWAASTMWPTARATMPFSPT